MASRSQLGVAAIMTSFIWHHPHHDVIILPSQRWRIHKSIGKNIHDFRHQITHFLVWFFKSHCIINNIVLHAYFYLKCNENCRKSSVPCSAQTQYSVLSATLRVCVCVCVMSDFRILHHFTRLIITGDMKIFVQNKIFFQHLDEGTYYWWKVILERVLASGCFSCVVHEWTVHRCFKQWMQLSDVLSIWSAELFVHVKNISWA